MLSLLNSHRVYFILPVSDGDRMIFCSKLFPTFSVSSVFTLRPEICLLLNINTLLLDIDNTLTTHNNPEPYIGLNKWISEMTRSGIRLVIISNNKPQRVAAFAKKVGLPYIARAVKPLPFGFNRAIKRFRCSRYNTAVVGDQLFTDILGANLANLKSILVTSITPEHGRFFRLKRKLEQRILSGFEGPEIDFTF